MENATHNRVPANVDSPAPPTYRLSTGGPLNRLLAHPRMRLMSDILVIGARGIPGVEGGAEKHAEYVFSRFAANGYQVTLLGTRQNIRCAEYRRVKLVSIPTIYIANTEKFVYH